ncbi:carbon storage regulator CsrA [Brevibacillus sp. B_LB10_24]|uniref:carbon storage regulator CsrA n=1 Tax=Brevibacillus sp. B_LB10_24 TaxID=3380645 RepID=UPI0038BD202A
MLVLSRKKNESIMVGDNIEIKVIGIEGDLVRIGIEAPREVEVYRKEIYLSIQEENLLASQTKADWSTLKQWIGMKPSDEE